MLKVHLDSETRSSADIKKTGMYRYVEDNLFRPLILAFRPAQRGADKRPIEIWTWGLPCPADLERDIKDGALLWGYNVGFELLVLQWLEANCGWPKVEVSQMRDTAAQCATLALPRRLEDAIRALGLPENKDEGGKRLINWFCKPARSGLFRAPEEHADQFTDFIRYCVRDVEVEELLEANVPALTAYEQQVWELDFKINSRGIRVDLPSIAGARAIAAHEDARLADELALLTGGAVEKPSQVARIVSWLSERSVTTHSLDKEALGNLLACEDLDPEVRRVLEIRKEAGKASVKKLEAFERAACSDGRVRGANVYHAASTGRFQSRIVNTNNMPRPSKAFEDAYLDTKSATRGLPDLFRTFRSRNINALPEMKGGALQLLSDSVRSFIIAKPGHVFLQADYSSIEGVVAACIAGEQWKIDAYREIRDDPTKPDLYRRTAAGLLGVPVEEIGKKSPFRQSLGKVPELALAYSAGCAALHDMAKIYNVDLLQLYDPVAAVAPDTIKDRAQKRYRRCLTRREHRADVLPEKAWLACEMVKIIWRGNNPNIFAAGRLLQDAAREAIQTPGQQFDTLGIGFKVAHNFLICRLPSGRLLWYAAPRLRPTVWVKPVNPDGSLDDSEAMDAEEAYRLAAQGLVRVEGEAKPNVTFLGVALNNKDMKRSPLTPGIAFENVVQAVARDILVNGMMKLSESGFGIVHHVYDEILTEQPIHEYTRLDQMIELMCQLPHWCRDYPISADGWIGKRYKK